MSPRSAQNLLAGGEVRRGGLQAMRVLIACLACAASAHAEDAGSIYGCVENIPAGGLAPALTDTFPSEGISGYATTLAVRVEHGRGETVLPRGLDLQTAGEAARALKEAGFALPDQDGGAPARLSVDTKMAGDKAATILELPLIPLPREPGRRVLSLPPLPISIARANGQVATACTHAHTITIEDATASEPEAKPRPNPPPLPQREEWTALKRALLWLVVGVLLGGLVAYVGRQWRKRPRPTPPPAPPRPAWDVALQELDVIRHAGLIEVGRFADYFDRVNDTVRSYLGARFGFDGLESTTEEILVALRYIPLGGASFSEIAAFLQECDLVKFASVVPEPASCTRALETGEHIVRITIPTETASGGSA